MFPPEWQPYTLYFESGDTNSQFKQAPSLILPMRCTATGEAFYAGFLWNESRHRYCLMGVKQLTLSHEELIRYGLLAPDPHEFRGRWPKQAQIVFVQYGAWVLDFTGFYCPLCRHGLSYSIDDLQWVSCPVCGQFVCGGNSTIGSIRQVFRCHARCGGQGIVWHSSESIWIFPPPFWARRQAPPGPTLRTLLAPEQKSTRP